MDQGRKLIEKKVLRIWVYSTVLNEMKPQLCSSFFLNNVL